MLLVNKDSKPEETVYYTASCALEVLKERGELTLDELHDLISVRFNQNLDYSTLVLGVNFLFLVDKVQTEKEKIKCI